jgi:hypothetical protein
MTPNSVKEFFDQAEALSYINQGCLSFPFQAFSYFSSDAKPPGAVNMVCPTIYAKIKPFLDEKGYFKPKS